MVCVHDRNTPGTACVYTWLVCVPTEILPVGHANIQTLPMLMLRSLQNCCCVLLLSKKKTLWEKYISDSSVLQYINLVCLYVRRGSNCFAVLMWDTWMMVNFLAWPPLHSRKTKNLKCNWLHNSACYQWVCASVFLRASVPLTGFPRARNSLE